MNDDPVTHERHESADERRDGVVARYSALARRAAAGHRPLDAPAGAEVDGCGPSAYGRGTDGPLLVDGTAAAAVALDVPEAALRSSLGCGNPVAVAELRPGEVVLDLGSGGGLDVVLSARRVGPTGRVHGLDASEDMIALAREHVRRAGADNVEFHLGYLEDLPLPAGAVDVVVSNCVLTLSTDKPGALAEAARVLRPGGRFAVSDVIASPGLDPAARRDAETAAGCPVGTLTAAEYRDLLLQAGFTTATVTESGTVPGGLRTALVHARTPHAPVGVRIRPMRDRDADQVLAVHQAGLDTGDASFETMAPTWDAFTAGTLPRHRHVAVAPDDRVLGWTAARPVADRCAYAGVIEHSVYVHPEHHGRGIGRALLGALVDASETAGVWTVQAGIFPENTRSLALHEAAGFTVVGTRRRIGRHAPDPHRAGRWRDVVLVERRSATIGVA